MIRVTITGRVAPHVQGLHRTRTKRSPDGVAVFNFRVSSMDRYKGIDGLTWFSCAVWGWRAEQLDEVHQKQSIGGREIVVIGRMVQEDYTAKDGTPASALVVYEVDEFKLVEPDHETPTERVRSMPAEEVNDLMADADMDDLAW